MGEQSPGRVEQGMTPADQSYRFSAPELVNVLSIHAAGLALWYPYIAQTCPHCQWSQAHVFLHIITEYAGTNSFSGFVCYWTSHFHSNKLILIVVRYMLACWSSWTKGVTKSKHAEVTAMLFEAQFSLLWESRGPTGQHDAYRLVRAGDVTV